MFYTHEKRFFLASKYARLENVTLVQRAYRSKYKTNTAPSHSVIMNIYNNFRKTGNLSYNCPISKKKRFKLRGR